MQLDEALRVPCGPEGFDVGACLDRPADAILERQGENGPHGQHRQHQRHGARAAYVVTAQQHPGQAHRGGHPHGSQQRSDQHVVVLGVCQLVGHHRERLVLRQVAHQGVVEHHPAGPAEAGDVGVQRGRAP